MVRCEAVRWVDDEPQPGLVEVVLTDVHGTRWSLIDKAPVFDATGALARGSDYPIPVLVACNVVERRSDGAGHEIVRIDLGPWGVSDQVFEVLADRITTDGRSRTPSPPRPPGV